MAEATRLNRVGGSSNLSKGTYTAVAQLAEALVLGTSGWWFESTQRYLGAVSGS
jgi:hypothetical protein